MTSSPSSTSDIKAKKIVGLPPGTTTTSSAEHWTPRVRLTSSAMAWRTQHVRDGVGYAAGGLLEISDLEVAQKTQGQHLPAKHDQDCGKYQKWAVFSHHRLVMEQLREHQPECGPQSTQQGKDADAAKQVQRAKHVLEQKADSDQIKKHSEGSRDSVVRVALGPDYVLHRYLANGSHIPRG